MSKQKQWFVAERVRALATMYLTRRRDLTLKFEDKDGGLDILVEIVQDERAGRRMFGVELRGTISAVSIDHANKILKPSIQKMRRFPELPYPICLFYFTMEDNAGYYTWLAEPVIKENAAKLRYHDDAHCQPLDKHALDQLVDRINQWYDILYTTLIA